MLNLYILLQKSFKVLRTKSILVEKKQHIKINMVSKSLGLNLYILITFEACFFLYVSKSLGLNLYLEICRNLWHFANFKVLRTNSIQYSSACLTILDGYFKVLRTNSILCQAQLNKPSWVPISKSLGLNLYEICQKGYDIRL